MTFDMHVVFDITTVIMTVPILKQKAQVWTISHF